MIRHLASVLAVIALGNPMMTASPSTPPKRVARTVCTDKL